MSSLPSDGPAAGPLLPSDHGAAAPEPRPVAGVLAVVIRDGQVLLVRRANPPDAGLWGFPGGKVEAGETIAAAAVRELCEETGIRGEAVSVVTAVDALDRDGDGRLRHHFILVAVLCRWLSGEPAAADDALEARWFDLSGLGTADLVMSFGVAEVARQAHALADPGPRPTNPQSAKEGPAA